MRRPIASLLRVGMFLALSLRPVTAQVTLPGPKNPPLALMPLAIDFTAPTPPPAPCPYGPGTTKNPRGETITADSVSFFLNGAPWVPIVGEFHYTRHPREEWRDALLKMKAGGINTVSTYVFWIHHEEERGKLDWTGQRSLRDFIQLAQEVGLKAMVRLGPWCHGEVRNGGFPDWVQRSGTKLRTRDPAFLKLVEPWFAEEAKQLRGLLWKDGGPVVAVQLDNECDKADYLLALKEMALAAGIDAPLYVITGWQGGLPREELIPLFGGYVDGFWGGSRENYRKEFLFTDVRAVNDLGAQMVTRNPANSQLIARFPYACVEIGGGMMSSYARRIQAAPADVAALTLAKLGSGNNMPGYYMYQGGTNPEGKLSTLQEEHPNQMPVKDYDFRAPLGAAGQVHETYHQLRQQHLFLEDFGPALARMPARFPERRPRDLKDFETLRWNVRSSDGRSGFLFFSNQQPYEPLPEHRAVQFEVQTKDGPVRIPRQPITIPTGSYGILPVNLDCDGVRLEYATAQPLCRVAHGRTTVHFLVALEGIAPELLLHPGNGRLNAPGAEREDDAAAGGAVRVFHLKTGTAPAATVAKADGSEVAFVVLTPEQGQQFYRVPFAGQPRAILSKGAVFADGKDLRLQAESAPDLSFALFPPLPGVKSGGAAATGVADGIFTRFANPAAPAGPGAAPAAVTLTLETSAGPGAAKLQGHGDAAWAEAAVYRFNLPASTPARAVLNCRYVGDAVRLYVGDRFVNDQFYNGDPFAIALWRIPAGDWLRLRLKVLPASDGLMGRLPEPARRVAEQAKRDGTLDQIAVEVVPRLEWRLSPP